MSLTCPYMSIPVNLEFGSSGWSGFDVLHRGKANIPINYSCAFKMRLFEFPNGIKDKKSMELSLSRIP